MAGESNVIKYISLDNLTLYDQLLKSYVDSGDAKSIKTVMLSQDGRSLVFYRDSEPLSQGAVPAYSIQIPETNLDSCMQKVVSALSGNVGVFNASGQVIDGGIALSALITRTDVEALIAQAVATSTHITTTVVQELPTDQNARPNVIYLYQDPNATGSDVYEEWMLINGTLTMIGDTSTDLTNYATQTYVGDRITAASTQIIADAVAQAGTAADAKDAVILAAAEAYTDQQVQGLEDAIDAVDTKADTNATNITNLGVTVRSNTDRIVALENATGLSLTEATEQEIRGLFTVQGSGSGSGS